MGRGLILYGLFNTFLKAALKGLLAVTTVSVQNVLSDLLRAGPGTAFSQNLKFQTGN